MINLINALLLYALSLTSCNPAATTCAVTIPQAGDRYTIIYTDGRIEDAGLIDITGNK